MGALFGSPSKGSSQSSSMNVNNDFIKSQFGGAAGLTGQAGGMLSALLGGGPGGSEAYDNFKNSAGYQGVMKSGSDAIVNNQAAKGMFQSGATGKALTRFGQETGKTFFNDYLDKILGMGNMGLGAGGLIANTGQVSKSSSSEQGGKKGILGSVLGGIL